MDAVSAWLHEWGPWIGGALVGVLPWIKLFRDAHTANAARRTVANHDRNELIKIAQEAAGEIIGDLREEVARLRREVAGLEAELSIARKEHSETMSSKDAELALLRGQLRQALATADAYERLLEANNIPHEKPMQPFWRVAEGANPAVEAIQP